MLMHSIVENSFDSVDTTMVTLLLLIVMTQALSRLMHAFGKPSVFGGVLAGVLISWLHLPSQYFDINACGNMGAIGVNLYLMILGERINYAIFTKRRGNLFLSLISALIPFICGIAITPFLYKYNHTALSMPEFSLIVGLCMAIASFSLISLFLNQSGLIATKFGQLGILAAGVDDLFFWLIYGSLLLCFQHNEIIRFNKLLIFAVYIVVISWLMPKLVRYISAKIKTSMSMLAFLLAGCLFSCILADSANIHQVFGAFVFGLMLPRDNRLIKISHGQLENVITVFFLPVFFAQVGILANTNIVADYQLLLIGGLVAIVAFVSKFISVYLPSVYLVKYSKQESAFLAALLNIRGVTEIILMKIFLEIQFISLRIFTIFVVVAMLTTWVATSLVVYFTKAVKIK